MRNLSCINVATAAREVGLPVELVEAVLDLRRQPWVYKAIAPGRVGKLALERPDLVQVAQRATDCEHALALSEKGLALAKQIVVAGTLPSG